MVDDVRDEMHDNIDMEEFGRRLLLIRQDGLTFVVLGGASVISCNRTSNGELY